MKNLFKTLVLLALVAFICSCEKDKGNLPNISFKTGGIYTAKDTSLTAGTALNIGITASKAEDKDVLKMFNISKSVNGAAATTVFSKDLTGTEGDSYSYDFVSLVDTTKGQIDKFTFTVTNRDGLTNQVLLKVTVK